jgi:hypothetical protein
MTSTFRTMKFNCKLVYTTNIIEIEIDSCKTISNLITLIKNKARLQFSIENNYDIEVAEAGTEISPQLEASEITLEEKYGNNYKFVSFYVRRRE